MAQWKCISSWISDSFTIQCHKIVLIITGYDLECSTNCADIMLSNLYQIRPSLTSRRSQENIKLSETDIVNQHEDSKEDIQNQV